MSSARTHSRNLVVNAFGHIANLVVLFFLSPFVVHTLGEVEYAIWSLVTVLTGYMGIMDLGVRASTGRYVCLFLGRGDHKRVDETIRTGLGLFSLVGVLILVAGIVLGLAFPRVFSSIPEEYHGVVKLLLPLMALNIWIGAFASVYSSVLAAHDRFDLARVVDLLVLGLRALGTVLALKLGYGVVGLAMVIIFCNLVAVSGNRFFAGRVYSHLNTWPLMLSGDRVRELVGYGVAAFIISISVQIIGQTDLVIVGITIGIAEVTVYAIGAMLLYYSDTLLYQIDRTFFPAVQRAVAKGEMGSARWLFLRQLRLALIFGLPMYIGYIAFGEPFLRLWMLGPEFGESAVRTAAGVMAILAVSKILVVFQIGAGSLLMAMGHVRFMAGLSLVQAILNLGTSLFFVLTLHWGLIGVAAGTLVARMLTSMVVLPWYVCRKAQLSARQYLLHIVGRGVLVGSVFAGICVFAQWLIPGDSWAVFWIQVCLALVCYVPIAFVTLPESDRGRILAKLRLALGRNAGSQNASMGRHG